KRNNWLSTRIPCAEFFPARDRALLSHATQIDPEGGFFSASRKAARTYWPTAEFELALDRTDREPLRPGADFQEGDLFAAVTFDEVVVSPTRGCCRTPPRPRRKPQTQPRTRILPWRAQGSPAQRDPPPRPKVTPTHDHRVHTRIDPRRWCPGSGPGDTGNDRLPLHLGRGRLRVLPHP